MAKLREFKSKTRNSKFFAVFCGRLPFFHVVNPVSEQGLRIMSHSHLSVHWFDQIAVPPQTGVRGATLKGF